MKTKNLLNKKITQWLLLVAMLVGCSANAWANHVVHGNFNNAGWKDYTCDSNGYVTITLNKASHEFGVKKNGSDWVTNGGTMKRDNCTAWPLNGSSNTWIDADLAGDYKFRVYNDNGTYRLTVTYPDIILHVVGNGSGKGSWCCGKDWDNSECSMDGAYPTASKKFENVSNNSDLQFKITGGSWGFYEYGYNNWDKDTSETNGATVSESSGNVKISTSKVQHITISLANDKIHIKCEDACTDPTVTTTAATSISTTTATLGGSYTGGSATPTEVGIEWTSGTTIAASSVTSPFTVSATGLTAGTTYKYKAYAKACGGNKVYGSEQTFTTLPNLYIRGPIISGNWSGGYEQFTNNGNEYTYTFNPNCSGYENGPKEFVITTGNGDSYRIPTANFSNKTGCVATDRDSEGTYNFKSTLKYLHSDEVTITIVRNSDSNYTIAMTKTKGSAPSALYIKGPLVTGSWDSYAQTGYAKDGNTYTFGFNAKTNDDRQFCISTTSSGDEGKIHCDMSASGNSGWNFKAEEGTNFQADGSIVSVNDTPIKITVTYNSTSGEFTMTLEKAGCEKAVPVAVYGSTFSRNNFKPKFKVTSIGDCGIKEAGVKVYSDASCTTLVKTATYSSPSNIEANKEYTLNVTELTHNTKYYCKAYIVTNDDETVLSSNTVEQATRLYVDANGSTSKSCNEQTLKANVYKGGANVTSVSDIKFNVYSDAACTALVGTFTGSAIANLNTSTATTATATGLTPNTQYWFRITATASTTLNGSSVDVSATSDASGTKYTFTTAAPSITPDVNSITFATHVVLGQESSALKIANYTFCGHSFTTSDFALTGTNATDFTLTQQSVSSGTASVKIRFTPKSGIGAKSANLVVKEGGNVISTIPVSATADCITPTKADYSVSGNTHIYDGTAKTAVITPNSGDYGTFTTGTAKYGGQASQTNVGEYTIHYTVPAGGNYCATNFDFDEKLTISKATLPEITGLPSGSTKCAGETEQLNPVCAGATSWEYSSSNTSIATVSNTGLITFKGSGDATITVTAKATNYNDQTKNVSVTTKAGPAVSASATNTTAYEVITLTSTSGSVTWSKSDAAAYFVKDNKAVDGDTVVAESVNFKAPAKVGAYTVGATSNGCTSNLSITIGEPHEVCN